MLTGMRLIWAGLKLSIVYCLVTEKIENKEKTFFSNYCWKTKCRCTYNSLFLGFFNILFRFLRLGWTYRSQLAKRFLCIPKKILHFIKRGSKLVWCWKLQFGFRMIRKLGQTIIWQFDENINFVSITIN